MGTTVTCPTFRYNPTVVAEAFASLSLLCPGRIFLGLGSGEALNEEAATGSWSKWPERSERLVEATTVIRDLWKGSAVKHQGKYYKVNAKLCDPPASLIPILMAGNGPKAMRRCGQDADGLITDPKTWKEHRSGAGRQGDRQYARLHRTICCRRRKEKTRKKRRSFGGSVPKPGNHISIFVIQRQSNSAPTLRFRSIKFMQTGQ
jgi:alkanesulfonate monooxygenase SsuD/methylene tetrahydromethanopterin reductase-like flavin-dependent oxidoreductase (luciferase family)